MTTAMMHYAKAVAWAASGHVPPAQEEAILFEAAVKRVADTRYIFNNTCLDILDVAREMMLGEIEYRKANYDAAYAHLRKSVEMDDNLPYDEPWAWMQPTRHALAALLLEQGHVEESAAVYKADLGLDSSLSRACQHPDNVWSLLIMVRFSVGLLGGAMIPIAFFPEHVQVILNYLPFRYLAAFPINCFLGKVTFADWQTGIAVTLFWSLIFTGCALLIWNRGKYKYTGVGI